MVVQQEKSVRSSVPSSQRSTGYSGQTLVTLILISIVILQMAYIVNIKLPPSSVSTTNPDGDLVSYSARYTK